MILDHNTSFFGYLSLRTKASYEAAAAVFEGINFGGCYFHLKQAMLRHLQDLGLSKKYNEDNVFHMRLSRLGALAFRPPGDVAETFAGMVPDFQPDETAFLKYFEKTWVGELLRTGLRKAPVFPVELWSVHGRALGRSFLPNNNAKVFHGNYQMQLSRDL